MNFLVREGQKSVIRGNCAILHGRGRQSQLARRLGHLSARLKAIRYNVGVIYLFKKSESTLLHISFFFFAGSLAVETAKP